jgi:epoxyqueuosine reductase QueG
MSVSPDPQHNRALLEGLRRENGLDLLGVADLRGETGVLAGLPGGARASLPLAIVIALRVSRGVLDTLEDGPNLLYFHHYRQLNAYLDRAATTIAAQIERHGGSALPIAASQIVDWERMAGQVSHRALGRLAGLGWHGRNNLLVTPGLGAQVRLATVLTDFPLAADHPIEGGCGPCRRCAAACPAGAIGDSAAGFDLSACYRKLDEFRRSRRVPQHICGMCVAACPGTAGPGSGGA